MSQFRGLKIHVFLLLSHLKEITWWLDSCLISSFSASDFVWKHFLTTKTLFYFVLQRKTFETVESPTKQIPELQKSWTQC